MSTAALGKTPKIEGTALAPLLYWLLVVSGLAGITMLRFAGPGAAVTSDDVLALWAGSVAGVGIGQLVSFARVRAWVPLVVAVFGFWFILPLLFLVIDGIFGASAQTFALAFLPASICGYLSLTERGALPAFWYPTVLWMIVILDGPVPGVFDDAFALPFVVGLAVLFVAFLRARQTRRVALWASCSHERLAQPRPRTTLRASPIRAASQHVWSAAVSAAALALTAWIAPHLWQTTQDPSRAASSSVATTSYASHHASSAATPCCPAAGKKRERVKEYFPSKRSRETSDDAELTGACRVCEHDGSAIASLGDGKWTYGGSPGAGLGAEDGPSSTTGASDPHGYGESSWAPATTTDDPAVSFAASDVPFAAPALDPATPATVPSPPTTAAPSPNASDLTSTPTPAAVPDDGATAPLEADPPARALPAPWKSSLVLSAIVFALVLASRALRRAVTLRHLARPFFHETFDQRISNYWQLVLIGLRDAGLEPKTDEQPLAFARRVGIEGMEACATILERVRHGVRVEADDLATMAKSAEAAFHAARRRAGFAARATAWLRAPVPRAS